LIPRRLGAIVASGLVLALAGSLVANAERSQSAPSCRGKEATVIGKKGDDGKGNPVKGTSGADVIVARGGDDFVDGKGGGDLICAGSGSDFVEGGGGKDKAYGDEGDDLLLGGPSDDKLFGKSGDDLINGQGSRDKCFGGPGADLAQCEVSSSADEP
jgi:Ca2+-binding RTX toxin-like protein